ncbi:MAG TPA: tetratricopeptide repeat protein, partial [Acetobacteraceae bacterium]
MLEVLTWRVSPRAALRRALRATERGKLPRAFHLLSRAARAGIAEAEYRVGRCYLEGAGVPPSRADGLRWLERAATHGYVEAQSLLATLLLQGLASSRHGAADPAIEGGTRPAARLFSSNDSDGKPDFEAAVKWARLAAEGGSADGQAVLGYILTSGPEAMRDLEAAEKWYRRSAEAGCPQGALGYALARSREATDEAGHR